MEIGSRVKHYWLLGIWIVHLLNILLQVVTTMHRLRRMAVLVEAPQLLENLTVRAYLCSMGSNADSAISKGAPNKKVF